MLRAEDRGSTQTWDFGNLKFDSTIIYLYRECCSRCRFQPYDCVIIRFVDDDAVSPPSSFVNARIGYNLRERTHTI